MTTYPVREISGALMSLIKYYKQSDDLTMSPLTWTVGTGYGTPPDCVAVRVRGTVNGGEVTYLTASDMENL